MSCFVPSVAAVGKQRGCATFFISKSGAFALAFCRGAFHISLTALKPLQIDACVISLKSELRARQSDHTCFHLSPCHSFITSFFCQSTKYHRDPAKETLLLLNHEVYHHCHYDHDPLNGCIFHATNRDTRCCLTRPPSKFSPNGSG